MTQVNEAADLLLNARLTGQPIPGLPADCYPVDLLQAYAIQNSLVEKLLQQLGGQIIGYKIACTNEAAQKVLNLDSPFFGRLFSATTFTSPTRLETDTFHMRVIEPEFAFEMAQDLPPRPTPFTRDEVTAAIGAIIPSIEIVDSRYQQWTTVGPACLIADQAAHGAWVRGQKEADWQHLDLATHKVELWVNGKLSQTGNGSVVLGHPLNALTWLANALREQNRGLQAGDWVTTGVCIDELYNAQSGDVVKADFGMLGEVEVSFN